MAITRRTALSLAAIAVASGTAAQPMKLRLGTATPGGGFPVYGAAFIEAIKAQDPALEIEAINTKGSTENVSMLEAGSLDIALVQGEVVHEALAGIGRRPVDLKVLTAMYPTAGLFVVRSDGPYRSIGDLKAKPIAWGASGSGLVILGRYVMDGSGSTPRRISSRSISSARATGRRWCSMAGSRRYGAAVPAGRDS